MSHCRASSLYDHLDHCFVVFKEIYKIASLREEFAFGETKSTLFRSSIFPGIFFHVGNLLEQTYDFPKCTMFLQEWILNPQDLLQSRSLETVPICTVCQCFPHDNIVCLHLCDEYLKSIDSGVCHRLWSILWWILQVCSLTIEYRVVHYVPSTSISEQFESILLTTIPRILILLLWNDGRQCKELILCRVVESFCLPTHNIVPHISWHDLPCFKTTKRYSDFPSMVMFRLLLRKFWIQTWFCNCLQYLCIISHCLWVHPRCTWSRNDVGSHKSTSLLSTFHIGLIFCFFPAKLMSSTYSDKNNPFFTVYK